MPLQNTLDETDFRKINFQFLYTSFIIELSSDDVVPLQLQISAAVAFEMNPLVLQVHKDGSFANEKWNKLFDLDLDILNWLTDKYGDEDYHSRRDFREEKHN